MSYVKGRAIMINKAKLSGVLGYTEIGSDVCTSGNWKKSLNLSYKEALACICENPSALDGVIATHKSLGPIRAQLHRIKVPISFGYLLMRDMDDCIRNEKLIALPCGMFFTKIFESYCIDFHDEPYEESYSQLKGGVVVKRIVKRDLAAERHGMEEEEVAERASNKASSSRSSNSSQVKLLLHVVEEPMAEVVFLTTHMCDMSKAYKSASGKSTTALEKSTERNKVLKKYVNKLRTDHMFSYAGEEEEENEEDESEPSDA
ncbi:hypothetical protein PIB30_043399 [Stylosanthes scabra]|uniref:Uncharacterized protein n=1 Tax=Stylosanthes scabra TaxID=79078 RepID=A0ABU6RG52_9FABA|nr:hypothetical protein [Stylosanthes scabra]